MASVLNSAVALCSLDDLKKFLAADLQDEFIEDTLNDNELERIINAVGQMFNTYTRRLLVSAERTQYYDGDGGDVLYVNAYPITSTTSSLSLWIDTERSYGAGTKIQAASIILYADDGKIALDDYYFAAARQTIKITYTGGYTLASTLPADLRLAGMMQCAWLWKQKKDKLFGVSGVSLMGTNQVIENVEQGILPFVKEILGQYLWLGRR